jgi:hypothetical protein
VLAFLGNWILGIVVTVLVIRQIPPEVPNPEEAYEGIGDYFRGQVLFNLGTYFSFIAAGMAGLIFAISWDRLRSRDRSNGRVNDRD